ncbi:MAG: transcriptional repressor [bacterium]
MPDTERKFNFSRQREVIYRLLAGTTSHPTAEWLHQQARAELPNLSLGTVYRNLEILKTQGRLQEFAFGTGQARFDATVAPHHHFVCDACGVIQDVFVTLPVDLAAVGHAATGLTIQDAHVEFHGHCADCSR